MIPERQVAEHLMILIRKFVPYETDCYTMLCDFYELCYGIQIPRYNYKTIKFEKPPDQVWKDWKIVSKQDAKPGDVVLFYSDFGMHLGILLDGDEFIHTACVGSPPCRIEKLEDSSADVVEFVRYNP